MELYATCVKHGLVELVDLKIARLGRRKLTREQRSNGRSAFTHVWDNLHIGGIAAGLRSGDAEVAEGWQ